jgi:hypothetical protein
MKKTITYIAVFVLGAVLSFGVQTVYGAERHPHIRTAIRELDAAKEELRTAAHDFGGHREAAMGALDAAKHQLEDCLKFDR